MMRHERSRSGAMAACCAGVLAASLLAPVPHSAVAASGPPHNTGVAVANDTTGSAGAAQATVTLNGATVTTSGHSSLDAGAAAQDDLQALQTTADSSPGLSPQQKAANHQRIQRAQSDTQALSAMALPSGAQTTDISATASASADGTTITVNPTAHRCSLRRATRQVDITTLQVEADAC